MGAEGASVLTYPPASDERGLVVRLAGPGGGGGGSQVPVTGVTRSEVAANAAVVQLLAADATRRGAVITNRSAQDLYLIFGAVPGSITDYTYGPIHESESVGIPDGHTYLISGIWAGAAPSGFALISSMTGTAIANTVTTATRSEVPATNVATDLLAANVNRRGAVITNRSAQDLYLIFGAGGSITDYTYGPIHEGESVGVPDYHTYLIRGVWAGTAPAGDALMTEMT